MSAVERRRLVNATASAAGIEAQLTEAHATAIDARLAWAEQERLLARVWERDDTLWPAGDDRPSERLGWLEIAGASLAQLDELAAFTAELRTEGFTDCVLLGMGGSSLAPEVLWQTFGAADGFLRLHVLDSTHPEAVARIERQVPLATTLFLLSSKSGGTLEPRSMHAHFHARVPDGRRWAAITDPGSSLEALAHEQGFRRTFHGAPDVGGRYSALSPFGVVPAALIGVDVHDLLGRAEAAARASRPEASSPPAALWLGLALAALAGRGRDKLTLVVDAPLSSLGLWLEQLIAESSGKQGRGMVPVADEPIGAPEAYGGDRVFVHVRHAHHADAANPASPGTQEALATLAAAGHPVISLPFADPLDLGAQFLRWELATAIACAALGVNAFDQPNVQESKDLTSATIEAYVRDGAFPAADAEAVELPAAGAALRALLEAHAGAGTYVATMAYLAPSAALDEQLAALRAAIRQRSGAATTVGYGPRFLHSTGQLHKGGPPSGVFLQLVDDGRAGVDIPGADYDFAALVRAQALGDGRALRERGLPFLRVQLPADAAGGVAALTAALDPEGSG